MLRRHTLGLTTFKDVSRPLTRNFSASVARNKQNLVILGSGWGGYEVLRKVDKKRWSESFRLCMFVSETFARCLGIACMLDRARPSSKKRLGKFRLLGS